MADQPKEKFHGTGKHQEVFNLLKFCLTCALMLGYPDMSHPLELETYVSFQGFGTVLSCRDENNKSCAIAYASRSLHPSEQLMQNYSLE